MKKFYLLCAAAMLSAATATAGIKVLYSQDFEGVTQATEAGWVSPSNPGAMSIISDEFGQYLQINHGSSNGRTYDNIWTNAIFGENGSVLEDGKYSLVFDFQPKAATAEQKQTNSAITVLSNGRCTDNQPFIRRWSQVTNDEEGNALKNVGYLFDLSQPDHVALELTPTTDKLLLFVNGNEDDQITLENTWYTISLVVDVNARTVEYEVADLMGTVVTSGTRTVPEKEVDGTDISMLAEGLHIMCGRTSTNFWFDNIKITCESEQDVANDPTVALTGLGVDEDNNLNLNLRTYTITFMEGETLVVKGPDGTETEVNYYDCNGSYKYSTTTSGTLVAYTVVGTAKSNEIKTEVDATPCALPAAGATIISVSEGYKKTYRLTVDNAKVPLSPDLFLSYVFTPADGGEVLTKNELTTGAEVELFTEGTLVVTTSAFGYQSTDTTIVNDLEFVRSAKYDFVHKTADEFLALGFAKEEDLNSATTSGEGNWTARKGMWYYDANQPTEDAEGNPTYVQVYPFGYIADDDTEHVIHRYKLLSSQLAECHATMFPGLDMWQDFNMQWKEKIGIIVNTMKKGDAEDGDGMSKAGTVPVKVCDLNATDFVLVKKVSNYGRDMAHPVCSSPEEYDLYELANVSEVYSAKEETVTEGETTTGTGVYSVSFDLYRIDTALAGIEVFGAAGASSIENVATDKYNANAPIFNLNGVRVNNMNEKGIYIQGGKKFVVK